MNVQVWLLCLIGTLYFTPGILDPFANSGSFRTATLKNEKPRLLQISKRNFSLGDLNPTFGDDSLSCIIPFTRAGNLILIHAKADTTQGVFVLDTGAPTLVLNITYFREYPTTAATDKGGITGSVAAAFQTTLDSFSFGPIKFNRISADLIDLGHIENSKGIKVFGLLGMQLFEQFEMIIDYEKSLLYLHRIGKKETAIYKNEMLRDSTTYHILPIDLVEDKIIVHGEMAGRKLRFVIDSGAETNVLDSRLSGKIFENVVITSRATLSGSGDQKVEALYGDMKNMKLGNQAMGTLHVLITNLGPMCLSYNYCLDGILGFDFLSLHKIGFNFVNRKMFIWK